MDSTRPTAHLYVLEGPEMDVVMATQLGFDGLRICPSHAGHIVGGPGVPTSTWLSTTRVAVTVPTASFS